MQSQMIGLQSSLDRILTHLQDIPQKYPPTPASVTTTRFPPTSPGDGLPSPETSLFPATPGEGASTSAAGVPGSSTGVANVITVDSGANNGGPGSDGKPRFPPLPGFAPPSHKYAIVPSTASSSGDDDSEDISPRATLNAPVEALQGLANAAAEVATGDQPPYVFLS